jgi:hypothetical protein
MLLSAARVCVAALAIAVPSAWGQTFTTFDPPGSLGTAPSSINPAGEIVGSYHDTTTYHGFLRATDGTITILDAPEAAPGPAYPNGTNASLITPHGLIVGTYFDANFTSHVFLRAKDGTYTTLVVPGAAGFTGGLVCNTEGAIAGGFFDSSFNNYGFLRAPSGKITVFAMPTSLPNFFLVGMTAGGEILGSSLDSNFVNHGFVRAANGTITTFDVPNAAPSFFGGTTPTSINNGGIATGFYYDTTQNGELRYFLRAANGTISPFNPPQEGFGSPAAINSSGAIVGSVQTFVCTPDGCNNTPVSFLRTASGTISAISDPDGAQGTAASAINPAGVITGLYLDANGQGHGFVRTPH